MKYLGIFFALYWLFLAVTVAFTDYVPSDFTIVGGFLIAALGFITWAIADRTER